MIEDNLSNEKQLLEQQKQFRKLVFDSYSLIRRDTSNIKSVDELDDTDKGGWIEHDDIQQVYDTLLDFTIEDEIDNVDWNSVDFREAYNAQYYQDRFPGFDERVYDILEKVHKEDNM